ncbi:hypothetical protein [Dyella terrae]|uniref:hypothetical protein n=1 Tax=Dyella terrae TaxID=522259 RepID=UPI001EFDCDE2|nr:hypothetical protein [Dyella terrae]ULU26582.1 hypothetical protein DYST_03528 [Dyella terrae]
MTFLAGLLSSRRSSSNFSPAQMFSSGQRGGWWDPSDLSTLFQDAAGTVPVTAPGQSVLLMKDKSGNNNHFSQTTSSQAPKLQKDANNNYYLALSSAASQFMSAGNGAALAPRTSSFMSILGGNPNSASTSGTFYARAQAAGTVGRYWQQPNAGSQQTNFNSNSGVATGSFASTATTPFVLSGYADRSTGNGNVVSRVNAAAGTTGSFTPDTGIDYNPSLRLLLGAYNNAADNGQQNYFDGSIYGFILVFDVLSLPNVVGAEKWIGKKCGVSL